MDIRRLLSLAKRDNYSLDAMTLKHVEECGELAEAVNHVQGRLPHKTMKEPLVGEVADNIICAVAVLQKAYPNTSFDDLELLLLEHLDKKSDKWDRVITNREQA
jgi:NTP pyrophosphatase (non-canonical NTP hydrolase)